MNAYEAREKKFQVIHHANDMDKVAKDRSKAVGFKRVSEFDNVVLAVGFISCPSRTTHLTSTARTTELNIGRLIITNP
jgi:hypothetical protein